MLLLRRGPARRARAFGLAVGRTLNARTAVTTTTTTASKNKKGGPSFDNTLLLPRTGFPMRPKAATREPLIRDNTFGPAYEAQKHVTAAADGGGDPRPLFVLHDGPPFANGAAHMGHALNKVLKDMVGRYHMLQGHRLSFVPGWDCHGMPIEHKVLTELRDGSDTDNHEGGKKKKKKNKTKNKKDKSEESEAKVAEKMAAATAASDHASPPLPCPATTATTTATAVTTAIQPLASEVRARCAAYARAAMEGQRREFVRWGVMADWNNPYLTMDPEYELAQLDVFFTMHQSGIVYQGFKPVYWSPSSQTALAEAELEYASRTSTSLYFRVPVHLTGQAAAELGQAGLCGEDVSMVAWTTTPWTLPANQAFAVHPEHAYVVVRAKVDGDGNDPKESVFMVGADRLDAVASELGWFWVSEPIVHLTGNELAAAATCTHPYYRERQVPVLAGKHVTNDAGTGIVHTAGAHGLEDFELCTANGVAVDQVLVLGDGTYDSAAGPDLAGLSVHGSGNNKVVEQLEERGMLLKASDFEHRVPLDWRTRKPVFLRATKQWFADVTELWQPAETALDSVKMFPESGRTRMLATLRGRRTWCVSRQRAWGVPIPVLIDTKSEQAILDQESYSHIRSVLQEHGTDAWWLMPAETFVPPSRRGDGCAYAKGTDTLDVWLDSGVSWSAVLAAREGKGTVADVYLEGSDQHRGWFQSSLLTSVAVAQNKQPKAPFKAVITHGFVLDEHERKMSKSLGNGVDPAVIVTGGKNLKKEPAYGADVLRTWVASTLFTGDVKFGPSAVAGASEQLRKLRNTCRFLLGNLQGFPHDGSQVLPYSELEDIDRYMLHLMHELDERVQQGYKAYQFHRVLQAINHTVTIDLSSFFVEIAKDRLYCEEASSQARQSAQTTLHHILNLLTFAAAPFACHLAEELYSFRKGLDPAEGAVPSIMQTTWPTPPDAWHNPQLAADWSRLRAVRKLVFRAIQEAKEAGVVAGSSDASVVVSCEPGLATLLRSFENRGESNLSNVFVCSEALVGDTLGPINGHVFRAEDAHEGLVTVAVSKTQRTKCPRCWRFVSSETDALCSRCATIVQQ
eukprot:m.344124 g.344124  ORF g.344124 m.344124 type:complete len:1079 (+) comp19853_c0_seq1:157-3393(+)